MDCGRESISNHLPIGLWWNLLSWWLQLQKLTNKFFWCYINIFFKLNIKQHIIDREEVLIVNFNSILFLRTNHGLDLLDSPSMDKDFLWTFVMECKLIPHLCSPEASDEPFATSNTPTIPSSSSKAFPTSPHNLHSCSFNKINSHSSTDCFALKNLPTNKILFVNIFLSYFPTHIEVISLDNPTKVDLSLILVTTNKLGTSIVLLFTHNFHIKQELATLIMDNDIQKNLVSSYNTFNFPLIHILAHTNLVGYKGEALIS